MKIQTADEQALLQALLEGELNMFEQAKAMHTLCSAYSFTQAELARRLGISQSCVGNKIRLLQFSPREQAQILEFSLTERHARTLLRIQPPKREKLIASAGNMHLTVQQTEELVEKYLDGENSACTVAIKDVAINAQGFVAQMQGGADRLRALGYKITCLTESGEAWTRITVTIVE